MMTKKDGNKKMTGRSKSGWSIFNVVKTFITMLISVILVGASVVVPVTLKSMPEDFMADILATIRGEEGGAGGSTEQKGTLYKFEAECSQITSDKAAAGTFGLSQEATNYPSGGMFISAIKNANTYESVFNVTASEAGSAVLSMSMGLRNWSMTVANVFTLTVNGTEVAIAEDVIFPIYNAADGPMHYDWRELEIVNVELLKGNNVIKITKKEGLGDGNGNGLNFDYLALRSEAKLEWTHEVGVGHSYGEWSIISTPNLEKKGAIGAYCTTCRDYKTEELPEVSATNGYVKTSTDTGAYGSETWTYTKDSQTFTFVVKNYPKDGKTYKFEAECSEITSNAASAGTFGLTQEAANYPSGGMFISSIKNAKVYKSVFNVTASEAAPAILNLSMGLREWTMTMADIFTMTVNGVAVEIGSDVIFPTADGVNYYDWEEMEIALVELKKGENVITIEKKEGLGDGVGHGLNFDYMSLISTATLEWTSEVGVGHSYEWSVHKEPTLESKGEIVAYCSTCRDYKAEELPVISAANGYTLVSTDEDTAFGGATWTYTKEGKVFTFVTRKYPEGAQTYKFEAERATREGTTKVYNSSTVNASGNSYLTNLSGKTWTITFDLRANKASQALFIMRVSCTKNVALATGRTLKVNGAEVALGDVSFGVISGLNWKEYEVVVIDLKAGKNTIALSNDGSGFVDLDCIKLITASAVDWGLGDAAHTHTEVIDAGKAATCTEAGLTEGKHCLDCWEVLVEQEVIPALGHKDKNPVDAKCDTCGEDLCANHVEVIDAAVEPTCTKTGLTEGKHCSSCGLVIVEQQEVAALGHSWANATCTEPKTCGVCGETDGEALGHNWNGSSCETCGAKTFKFEAECAELTSNTAAAGTFGLTQEAANYPSGGMFISGIKNANTYESVFRITASEACTAVLSMSMGLREWELNVGNTHYIKVNDVNVEIGSDVIYPVYNSANGPINYDWHEMEIVTISLQKGENVIVFGKNEGIGNAVGGGLNFDYMALSTTATLQWTSEVENGGHSFAWTVTSAPTYESEGEMVSAEYCETCREKRAAETVVLPVISEANGYTKVVSGASSIWEYTHEGEVFSFSVEEDVVIKSYVFDVNDAEDPSKEENELNPFIASNGGTRVDSNSKYGKGSHDASLYCYGNGNGSVITVTISVSEATVVTFKLINDSRAGGAFGYYPANGTGGHQYPYITNFTLNGKTDGFVPSTKTYESEDWNVFHHCELATLTLQKGVNVIGFTIAGDNINYCGIVVDSAIPVTLGGTPTHTHAFELVSEVPAGCETTGTKAYYKCECGVMASDEAGENVITAVETIPATGHTPKAAVEENRVESTCKEAGSYDEVVYCSACNAEISRTKKALELAAHTPKAAVEENRVESTCKEAGSYDEVVYCSACNAEISRTEKSLALKDHTYGDAWDYKGADGHAHVCTAENCGAKDTVVTHTSSGAATEETAETCTECGYEIEPKLDHVHVYTEKVEDEAHLKSVATNCQEYNVYWYDCAGCNVNAKDDAEAADKYYESTVAGSHSVSTEWTTTEVKHYYECTVQGCDYVANEETHTVVIDAGKAPTCTETGLTEGKHCSVCSKVLLAQTVVDALGHTWKNATCTDAKTCSVCSATEGDALGHDYDEGVVTTDPTCTAKGVKTFTCKNDATHKYMEDVDMVEHTWKDATCTEPKTCGVCGETDGDALGHSWNGASCTLCGITKFTFEAECSEITSNTASAGTFGLTQEKANYPSGGMFISAIKNATTYESVFRITASEDCTAVLSMSMGLREWELNVATTHYIQVNGKAVEIGSDVIYPVSANGPNNYDWYEREIVEISLQKGENVIAFGKNAGIGNANGGGLNFDYMTLSCKATLQWTVEVENGGHTYGEWETITAPTYENVGKIERYCATCRDYQAVELPTVSEANGYTKVASGASSIWNYTHEGTLFTFSVAESVAVTSYVFNTNDADDPSVEDNAHNPFAASNGGSVVDSNKNYKQETGGYRYGNGGDAVVTTTISVSEATVVTFKLIAAWRSPKTFGYTQQASGYPYISSFTLNGSTDNVVPSTLYYDSKGFYSYTECELAMLILQKGANVISFTIKGDNVNYCGIVVDSVVPVTLGAAN